MARHTPVRVLVAGPESSGTKLLTQLINEAGGEAIHLSMPYGGGPRPGFVDWPDLDSAQADVVVISARDPYALICSQIENEHVDSEAWSLRRIQEAYRRIFAWLTVSGLPFFVIPYEALVLQPDAKARFVELLELNPESVTLNVQDANSKYYGGTFFRDQRTVDQR